MFEVIRSETRGAADHGWLNARHSFSFADYHDPERMGFGSLRVINEDRIAAGKGFGTHPHRDMEIVTYIIDGSLEHKDSMGNGSVIRAGELQRMTAGTGVFHSEFNPTDDTTHLMQIWILPEKNSLEPGYEQKLFPRERKLNQWCLLGARDGRDGALTIHQDVELWSTILEAGLSLDHELAEGRRAYLQVVRGGVDVDGETLVSGDALAITNKRQISISAAEESELLLFDLS
jgi:redox-sensitive bicupin YhaK (pirin superfamily)